MENKEQEEGFVPRAPDYSGEGVSIWKAKDKNGKTYLKTRILGGLTVNCFRVEQREEEDL